jgi:peptidoglycan/LPS O-acetylase OafA/YrhL
MLLFVTVTVLVVVITGVDRASTLHAVPVVLIYVENWWAASGQNAGALGHMWSLSVEEQFYLIWPAIVVLALRGRRGALALVAMLGVAWAFIERERSCAVGGGYCVHHVYMSTDTRMDQLLLGALLAIGFHRGALAYVQEKTATVLGWLAIGLLVAFTLSRTPWDSHFYDTVGMTGTACLMCVVIGSVLRCPGGRLARVLSWRPLRAVGLVSYGIYLWDELFLVLLRDGTSLGQYQRAALIVLFTAIAAAVSWRFVERPILTRAKAGTGLRAAAHETGPKPSVVSKAGADDAVGMPGQRRSVTAIRP